MASSIVQLSGAITGDKCIRLNNSRCARLHGIPAGDWTTLRLGFRVNFLDTGGDLSGTPGFSFGFCSGVDNVPPGANGHALYVDTNEPTWDIQTTTGSYMEYSLDTSSSKRLRKMQNGAVIAVANGVGRAIFAASNQSSSPYWSTMVFLEVTKATSSGDLGLTWDVQVVFDDIGSTKVDSDDTDVITCLELSTMLDITSQFGNADYTRIINSVGVASSEVTFGELNSVFWSWDRASSVCNIGSVFLAIKA